MMSVNVTDRSTFTFAVPKNRFLGAVYRRKRWMSPEVTQKIEIDRSDPLDRYRFVCPNGHTTWDRTNCHGWCASCAAAAEHDPDIDPEHWEILDKKSDRLIPYEMIEFVEER